MFWFKKTTEPEDTRALTEDQLSWLIFGEGAKTAVSTSNALHCTAVFCAVKTLSETISQLPVHLYQRLEQGKERAPKHPAGRVLKNPNPWTSGVDFKKQLMVDLSLHGNAYCWVGRNTKREPVELRRMDPASVSIDTKDSGEPVFKVTNKSGQQKVYPFSEILHFRGPSRDGVKGESPIEAGRNAIALAMTLESHGLNLFENGARPSGVIETKEQLGNKGRKRLREAFTESFAGSMNAGKVPVLDEGMTYKSLAMASADAQYLELRRFAVLEIARLYRLPPHFLADMTQAKFSNVEEMGAQFLTYSIMPWVKVFEAEFAKLLSPKDREEYYFEFLIDDLARAAMAVRFEAYAKAVTNGILSPNEARSAENRPPYQGGDQFRLPMNTESAA